MSMPEARPWRELYPAAVPAEMTVGHDSLTAAWRARVARDPDAVALRYFDGALTAREVDSASDALACAFAARGTGRGDRVGIYLQNIPQYALVLLALWKLGATALLLNPMYRRGELRRLIDDAGAVGVVCADLDVEETRTTLAGSSVRWTVSTSALEFQTRNDPRAFPSTERPSPADGGDLAALLQEFAGRRPEPVDLTSDDVALLTYTSGTTGPPKGAMNSHGNVLNVALTNAAWADLADGDTVYALAPLFHITGAVVNGVISLVTPTTLVLTGRFRPEVALDALAEHQVTYMVGSITAYNAMYAVEHAGPEHFASAKHLFSGGAPIPPATVDRFRERFGVYIHNIYGMTETSSAVIAVPPGTTAPVHEASGTLSIGVPLPNLTARVVDLDGNPLPPGEQGELELSGPQVVAGYWQQPAATEQAVPGGRLRTGDGAIIDEHGWVYLVDRLKDQINASGYKVWPREVEDALYEHPAVHEAAVVGQPDDYRGETVVAYVSLTAGASVTPDELISFTRERLAAYKRPTEVHIRADLPKTQTGKIRRTALRRPAGHDVPPPTTKG
ncbi:AMP-binding protein [Streptomyces sp. M2CJ-2]|uniref:class I adenylate-forming enzyme family protein n=1 Tax=Streptomyces sp. M2CJ-2 TaxID=2803948 RepID=UPI001921201F|nr:AMP-binding protein [Streptomyces sp. M2CJ-2]MBL3665808.1 AMP-binding protein [Streptomyces sp. M2CJ-2]